MRGMDPAFHRHATRRQVVLAVSEPLSGREPVAHLALADDDLLVVPVDPHPARADPAPHGAASQQHLARFDEPVHQLGQRADADRDHDQVRRPPQLGVDLGGERRRLPAGLLVAAAAGCLGLLALARPLTAVGLAVPFALGRYSDCLDYYEGEREQTAPGAPTVLAPGGLHIMLIGLKQKLAPGDSVPLTLVFEHAGEITIEAPVRGMAGLSGHGGHGTMGGDQPKTN